MDKNLIIALIVSVVFFFFWGTFYNNQEIKTEDKVVEVEKEKTFKKEKKQKEITYNKKNIKNGKTYFIENEYLKLELNTKGASVNQITFKKYKTKDGNHLRFFSSFLKKPAFVLNEVKDASFYVYKKNKREIIFKNGSLTVSYFLSDNPYVLKFKTNIKNKNINMNAFSSNSDSSRFGLAEKPEERQRLFLLYDNEDLEELEFEDLKENKKLVFSKAKWVGLSDRYFLVSFLEKDFLKSISTSFENNHYFLKFKFLKDENNIYIGPKDVNYLKTLDKSLVKAVDFGILSIISVPMLELMKFFYDMIPNYGVAILLLTLLIRLIMFPLQHKSMKAMKKMQDLQPHIKKLQEKYKEDKEKLNKEIMQLMKIHKANPMGGCLPLLLQLPVFFALYRVLGNAVELYNAPFLLWITDLSAKDPYYVMPILMGIMMFLQQKLTPSPTTDPMQKKMMMFFMPIMFTVIMISLPSGLTLYIMFSTFLGLLQQLVVNRSKS
jgi:YidC/Oxa1 family membrane protein insertase